MKAQLAMLGAAAAMLSFAAFSTPASAQRYYRDYDDYGRTVTRCDRDGDRCATYRCDRDGDDCRRISGWYARSHIYGRRYSYGYGRYDRDHYYDRDDNYGYTVRRCDRDGDDCYYLRCDRDGDDCRRL